MKIFTHRDGELRIYDGSPTPYYLRLLFVQAGFTAPLGRPRPQEMPILDRDRLSTSGVASAITHHYIAGPDTPLMTPMQMSFQFTLANGASDPNYQKFRQALTLDMAATWTVGL